MSPSLHVLLKADPRLEGDVQAGFSPCHQLSQVSGSIFEGHEGHVPPTLARDLKMKSFRIHLSSSNVPCVTQSKGIGTLELSSCGGRRSNLPCALVQPFSRPFL